MRPSLSKGFTLSELLIALAILGVIATFTIPKVLQSQADERKIAAAKEMYAAVSEAYAHYLRTNSVTASTSGGVLTPYLNFIKRETSGLIDNRPGLTSQDCANALNRCYRFANGGILQFQTDINFGGTESHRAIPLLFDPDGSYSGSTSGSGKAINIWLYTNSRVTSYGGISPGTEYVSGGSPVTRNPDSSLDPVWFRW